MAILNICYYDTTIMEIDPKIDKQHGLALNQFIQFDKKDFKLFL